MVDMSSRWVELAPLMTLSAAEAARAFVNTWVLRFGVPKTLQSDGGTQFRNSIFSGLADRIGFVTHYTTPYHPQSNGIVERANSLVERILRARRYHIASNEWIDSIPIAQWLLNNTARVPTRLTPAEIVYGFSPVRCPEEVVFIPSATDVISEGQETWLADAAACRHIAAERIKASVLFSQSGPDPRPEVTSPLVLVVYPERPPDKLAAGLRGPMRRVENHHQHSRLVAYTVEDMVTGVRSRVDASRVLPFEAGNLTDEAIARLSTVIAADYISERIVECSGDGDVEDMTYLVEWRGYEQEEATWEPFVNLDGNNLFQDFLDAREERRKKFMMLGF
ncbi:hypothetical protein J8273_6925 [Carpediemonas membranifera]|uniref:Integrase core domain-containing protein n=1 Tax=Carpediemonas membranifera TaxID=201153 RepID=A0A8J6AQ80_9EUKA|nr:hypothetical protein J8273_6925 [Carpediemonas membranifera]|eukprot:KAG9390688.1 hypothetical protein J8273_6925 [Carpediemonas membranifera]